MGRPQYDFYTLVTCLLILALQIHNPFQRAKPSICDGVQHASLAGLQQQRQLEAIPPSPSSVAPAPTALRTEGAPVSQLPREVSTSRRPAPQMSTEQLLRELDSLQVRAKEQQETLAAAGRMPPASPILQQLRTSDVSDVALPSVPTSTSPAPTKADTPLLRRREDFGRFLEARQPRGLGVVLGVGRGDFAIRLLADWVSSQGLYLVDPYIHIFRGYDDSANVRDHEHQLIFEDLRNRLAPFEGRYALVRDFSHSFAAAYQRGSQSPGMPTFVYIDANHAEEAVSRDLELWWPLVAPGGLLAGSMYADDASGRVRVKSAVDRFAARHQLQVYLTHDDMPPSWLLFKTS